MYFNARLGERLCVHCAKLAEEVAAPELSVPRRTFAQPQAAPIISNAEVRRREPRSSSREVRVFRTNPDGTREAVSAPIPAEPGMIYLDREVTWQYRRRANGSYGFERMTGAAVGPPWPWDPPTETARKNPAPETPPPAATQKHKRRITLPKPEEKP